MQSAKLEPAFPAPSAFGAFVDATKQATIFSMLAPTADDQARATASCLVSAADIRGSCL